MTQENTNTPLMADCSRTPCYASFWGRLLRRYDQWIYRRAFHTLRRMAIDNPGFAYLMELQIRGWNEQTPIPDSLKSATEQFHAAMHRTMILCPMCGNKRCPHANDRTMRCTNSNEVGQVGIPYQHNS